MNILGIGRDKSQSAYFSGSHQMPEYEMERGQRPATPPGRTTRLGPRQGVVWWPPGPSPSRILASGDFQKNRYFGFCAIQFREYSFSDFPRTKNSRKQAAGTVALVNRLVQEII